VFVEFIEFIELLSLGCLMDGKAEATLRQAQGEREIASPR